jgi:hypothetical protein
MQRNVKARKATAEVLQAIKILLDHSPGMSAKQVGQEATIFRRHKFRAWSGRKSSEDKSINALLKRFKTDSRRLGAATPTSPALAPHARHRTAQTHPQACAYDLYAREEHIQRVL